MSDKLIDEMRAAMGTLPSRQGKKNYDYDNAITALHLKMIDGPENPYKNLVNLATSTWGTGALGEGEGSTGKWAQLSPEARFKVVLAVLTGNTLPVPMESLQFSFEVNGCPRHTFDQFARARIGMGFCSIGSRDNNKLDAPFLFYDHLMDMIEEDPEYRRDVELWIRLTKDLYEATLEKGEASWQEARAFLPMSYNHSFTFTGNYLALRGQCGRRLMACEEGPMVALMWKIRQEIMRQYPLLVIGMIPACDRPKRCIYHEGPEGLTKYFSNLFADCGRWPSSESYSEFNRSCTSYEKLKELGVPVYTPEEINALEEKFKAGNLFPKDQAKFEED